MLIFQLKRCFTRLLICCTYFLFVGYVQAHSLAIKQTKEEHKCFKDCGAIITNENIDAQIIIQAVNSGLDFCAQGVTITGVLNFDDLSSAVDTIKVRSQICITNSVFKGDVRVASESATLDFSKSLTFSGSKFLGRVYISSSILRQRVDFKSCHFDEEVIIFNSEFKALTGFAWSEFGREFNCQLSKFYVLDFDGTTFEQDFLFHKNSCEAISFIRSKFQQNSFLNGNLFCDSAKFREAQFYGDFIFTSSRSSSLGCNYLTKTFFDFGGSVFRSRTIFSRSYLDSVSFCHDQQPTLFLGAVDFSNVQFGSIRLKDVFFGSVDFSGSQFVRELEIHSVSFSTMDVRWKQLKQIQLNGLLPDNPDKGFQALPDSSIQSLINIVELLEANFRKLGYLDDANEAFYLNSFLKGSQKSGFEKIFDRYIMHNLLGYLVKPWTIMRWSFVMILVFSGFYFLENDSLRLENIKIRGNAYNDSLVKGPPIEYFKRAYIDTHRWNMEKLRLAFMLSLSIFLKFPFLKSPSTTIFIPIRTPIVRFFAWVEWMLGLTMGVLFLISLSQTVPILNDLISKLF